MNQKGDKFYNEIKIYALATDPIYVGTGGYSIGRVDNTIVRDPITNIPKIPGSSLGGTWRYYVALEAHKYFINDELRIKRSSRANKSINDIFKPDSPNWVKNFEGNKYIAINCAGQDDLPNKTLEEMKNIEYLGHCGHCIVCKGFGFSKKDISWQGQVFFSDLNILLFPVFTIKGTRWITTKKIVDNLISNDNVNIKNSNKCKICVAFEKHEEADTEGYINLGWLYLPFKFIENNKLKEKLIQIIENLPYKLSLSDIIIVPEDLFSQIVNSNLEVRTSVSIDPITGAAKEGALFTSEAIPRGTIFYGEIRIFDKKAFEELEDKLKPLPTWKDLLCALEDSKHYYKTLGIGGMTTRGFGRLNINLTEKCPQNGGKENE